MANFNSVYRTNFFRVTDEKAYDSILRGFLAEDLYVENTKDSNGNILHFFGGYGYCDWFIPASKNKEIKEFIKEHKVYDENNLEISIEEIDKYDDIFDENGNLIFARSDMDNEDFDVFLNELQTILPDGEVFTFTMIGNEKLRDVMGSALVMTNKAFKSFSIDEFVDNATDELTLDNK